MVKDVAPANEKRSLYVNISNRYFEFLEDDRHRLRLPGKTAPSKARYVEDTLEIRRELRAVGFEMNDSGTPSQKDIERLVRLAKRCANDPILPANKGR